MKLEEIKIDDIQQKTWDEEIKIDNVFSYPRLVGSTIIGGKALIGSGNNCLKFDERNGLWLGHTDFASAPFRVNLAGAITANSLTMTGGTIKYGKSSFSDSTNAGYYIGSEGIYLGAAADATKLKYTIADGTFDFIGTISGRSTATIASAINVSGNLINNVINANLDTSAKQILGSFTFGSSGAIAMATDANNGLWLSPTGILGKNAGAITFTIDTFGNAFFAGTLLAAAGTLGTITAGTLTGCTFQTAAGTGQRMVMSSGDNSLKFYDASNNNVIHLGPVLGGFMQRLLAYTTDDGGLYIGHNTGVRPGRLISLVKTYDGVDATHAVEMNIGGANSTGYGIYLAYSAGAYPAYFVNLNASSNYPVLYLGRSSSDPCLVANTSLGIFNNAMPAAIADMVQYGGVDLSAGNTMPAIRTEGTNVGTGTPAANRTVAVQVNGTTYYLLASTSAS